MIEYNRLKSGDTLKVGGKPHYDGHGDVAVESGAVVQVDEVHAAGVTVKTEAGKKISFYFEHGAEKLDYTKETKESIKQRESFGKDKQSEAKDDRKSEEKDDRKSEDGK